jgi:hypothetical protein
MKQTSLDAIRTALNTLLVELQKTPVPQEGHWVYQRNPAGHWQGAFVPRPGGYNLLTPHENLIDRLSNELSPVLNTDYPDHMAWIGLPGAAAGVVQPRMIVGGLAHECLKRHGSFAISDQQLDELLRDAAGFFDQPNIRIRLSAPVLNVHGPRNVPPITFPGGVVMRAITDEEATLFYGGNPIYGSAGRMLAFPDFLFVQEIEVQKVIGKGAELGGDPFWKPTQELLERCILAISSFKDGGPVGYDGLRLAAAELAFGAALGGQHFWSNEHVPTGHYNLAPEEAPKLEAYAKHFEDIHPTLEMACQRLVDSGRRTKPRDGIVDAVIGLESILLVEIGDRYRGETRFRFSLNYASLFSASDREKAFYTARDLYDLRSQIAHGGEPRGNVKIGSKELNLYEIAAMARSILRETLAKFMSDSAKPAFLADRYWVKKTLGL